MSDEIVSGGQPWAMGREIETAGAVADIEDHPALPRREGCRNNAAVLHDIGEFAGEIGQPGKGVSEDIARPHRGEDERHQLACLHAADMDHYLAAGAGILAGRDGPSQWFDPELADDVLRHADLDADHHVGVRGDGLGGGIDIGVVDDRKLGFRERCESDL
jgi:hypothetical protein